jgi:hypothetical protein
MNPEKTEKPEKVKKNKQSRSVETMFRTTMSSHVHMTMLADRKAGLMISINSIILSIMMSFLVGKYDANNQLLIPTFLLSAVCLLTIVFALLSTKPTIKSKKSIKTQAEASGLDLLFFGDYLSLSPEEYKHQMKELIKSDEKIQDKMIENIYIQGRVMNRKFWLLTIAYNVFMFGFPLVVLCYLIAIYFS